MSITERINADLKTAMIKKDKVTINTLRLLKTALKIEKNDSALNQSQEEEKLFKAAKQRKDSANTFLEANRKDLAENELAELAIIEKYLPKQLTEEEIKKVVKESISETKAGSMKDIGILMKVLMPKLKGKADGKIIQATAKEELS